MSTLCIAVPVAHSGGENILEVTLVISSSAGVHSCISHFFVHFVPIFHLLMLTPIHMCIGSDVVNTVILS